MSTPFSVKPFTAGNLYSLLSNAYCSTEDISQQGQALYLSGYLNAIGTKTIVAEEDYTDGDYLEDFASYYVRCFQGYSRRCRRLHFFKESFDEQRLLEILSGQKLDTTAVREKYLGFVVARPLPSAIIGRTVLQTYESDQNRRHYRVVRDYSANLFGIELSVRSLVFQEQDTVLAACATVALWSAFHKTSELFGTLAPRPAEITRTANGVASWTRAIPSHGLDIKQMAQAIRSVGLEPEVVPTGPKVPLVSLAYSYLNMGIPVILGIEIENVGMHAITLTGYSLQKDQANTQEVAGTGKSIPMIGLRIDEFYAHDDQIGPFSRIVVKPSAGDFPVLFEGQWRNATTQKVLTLSPRFVLVPVYNKMRVTFLDVVKWLERFSVLMPLLLQDDTKFEWDLRITTNNNLKTSIKNESFPVADLKRILMLQQPRFIWRATLSVGNQPIVDFFADATDMERSLPIYEKVWHHSEFHDQLKKILEHAPLRDILSQVLQKRFLDFLKQTPD